MKIFISIDMEGIAGTFNWDQEDSHTERNFIRRWMRKQVEWVIKGLHESPKNDKVEEILIADSHNGGDNLEYDITELDNRLYLISGTPRPQYMMAGLDKSFDMVFLLGYHAGVGTVNASMDHTFSNSTIHNIWINDIPMNETLLNAAYAGYFEIPVTLITGDIALKQQLDEMKMLNEAEFVVNKEALGRFAAKHYPMELLEKRTKEAVVCVLGKDPNDFPVFDFKAGYDNPIVLKIAFNKTEMADLVQLMPFVKRLDARTVEFKDHHYKTVYNAVEAISKMAKPE